MFTKEEANALTEDVISIRKSFAKFCCKYLYDFDTDRKLLEMILHKLENIKSSIEEETMENINPTLYIQEERERIRGINNTNWCYMIIDYFGELSVLITMNKPQGTGEILSMLKTLIDCINYAFKHIIK